MRIFNFRIAAVLGLLAVLAWAATVPTEARAQTPAVDPTAVRILQKMTDYLGSLQQFSVQTQNTLEDELGSGHRIDHDISASVIISRPDKLQAERQGDLIDQVFFYDGKWLTLYNPADKVYATVPAPATIEGMLDLARESLGLMIPAADLVYRNAFPLLMQDVTLAKVVGKAVIDGVRCDHLLFSRPGVDFQVWVADSGPPWPRKYVVTDTATAAWMSITTVMRGWNPAPAETGNRFTFVPPQGARRIAFLPLETSSGANR